MTTKEAVVKAWMQDKEVEIKWTERTWTKAEGSDRWEGPEYYKGWIHSYDMDGLSFRIDSETDYFRWSAVSDIRFVGESGVENPCLYHGCELRDECNAARKFHKANKCHDFKIPDPVEGIAKADRSYPHCDETECKERQGGGLYCKDEACDTRNVFVGFKDSFREDPKPDKKWPPDEDVAKQRWEWVPVGTGEGLVGTDESGEFIYVDTPQQRTLQAAAPELADALRMVARKPFYNHFHPSTGRIYITTEEWNIIIEALEKAGLEDITIA